MEVKYYMGIRTCQLANPTEPEMSDEPTTLDDLVEADRRIHELTNENILLKKLCEEITTDIGKWATHPEFNTIRQPFRLDQSNVAKYMQLVARSKIDGHDVDAARDNLFETLSKSERDECNRLVVLVFRDYL